ncbi:MAG: hypothetical protein U1E05_00485 [Patescibacteria group bacterium]|nr:hypothetical protein [Patescibacteria group bacterium]
MFPTTPNRVPSHTDEQINQRIQDQIRRNVAHYGGCSAELIDFRLEQLDEEWDVERALEFNAAALATGSIVLGLSGKKRWFFLAAVVTAFLAQHALQGWCPPLPLLRRLGMRTAYEIDRERYALKALRGDFQGLKLDGKAIEAQVDAAMTAVR